MSEPVWPEDFDLMVEALGHVDGGVTPSNANAWEKHKTGECNPGTCAFCELDGGEVS